MNQSRGGDVYCDSVPAKVHETHRQIKETSVWLKKKTIYMQREEEKRENRPGDEGRHERVRVFGLEGFEEGPHVPNVRPSQITWWQIVLLLSQLHLIHPPIHALQNPSHPY